MSALQVIRWNTAFSSTLTRTLIVVLFYDQQINHPCPWPTPPCIYWCRGNNSVMNGSSFDSKLLVTIFQQLENCHCDRNMVLHSHFIITSRWLFNNKYYSEVCNSTLRRAWCTKPLLRQTVENIRQWSFGVLFENIKNCAGEHHHSIITIVFYTHTHTQTIYLSRQLFLAKE